MFSRELRLRITLRPVKSLMALLRTRLKMEYSIERMLITYQERVGMVAESYFVRHHPSPREFSTSFLNYTKVAMGNGISSLTAA